MSYIYVCMSYIYICIYVYMYMYIYMYICTHVICYLLYVVCCMLCVSICIYIYMFIPFKMVFGVPERFLLGKSEKDVNQALRNPDIFQFEYEIPRKSTQETQLSRDSGPCFISISIPYLLDGSKSLGSNLVWSLPGSHYWAPHFSTWPTPEYTWLSALNSWRPRPESHRCRSY